MTARCRPWETPLRDEREDDFFLVEAFFFVAMRLRDSNANRQFPDAVCIQVNCGGASNKQSRFPQSSNPLNRTGECDSTWVAQLPV